MGYELYITRASSWLDAKQSPISEAEWEAVVAADPELEISLDEWCDLEIDGKVERIHPIVWEHDGDRTPLWFCQGAVDTKNPGRAAIQKMVELAGKLKARVLGEEDEEYGPDGTSH